MRIDPDPSPFVGRETELNSLIAELRSVREEGTSRATLIRGEIGVGKTRLSAEIQTRARVEGFIAMRGSCTGYATDGSTALLPIRHALSASLQGDPSSVAEFERLLGDLLPLVRRYANPLSPGSTPVGDEEIANDPFVKLGEIFRVLASDSGLCLVIEDVEDADPETRYFLTHLLDRASVEGLLVLLEIRADSERHEIAEIVNQWLIKGWHEQNLGCFDAEATRTLVEGVLNIGRLDDEVVDRLHELTGGNALFLVETLRTLPPGPTMATLSVQELNDAFREVPRRIQAVLDRRMSGLDEELVSFLQVAAVCLGTAPLFDPIPSVLRKTEEETYDLVGEAMQRELLSEPGRGEMRFVNDALRQHIYDGLPAFTRRRIHLAGGDWCENANLSEPATEHFLAAGDRRAAARTALRAGDAAARLGMHHRAAQLYEIALDGERPPEEVRPRLARAMINVGRLREAEEIIGLLDAEEPDVQMLLANLRFNAGDYQQAAHHVSLAADGGGDGQFDHLVRSADIHLHIGSFAQARNDANRAYETAQSPTEQARALGILGATAYFSGDLDRGQELFSQARQLLDDMGDQRNRARYTVIVDNLGQVAESRADWPRAEELHADALQRRRRSNDHRGVAYSAHALARVKLARDDNESAERLLGEAEDLAQKLYDPLVEAKVTLTRAQIAIESGDTDQATVLAQLALDGFRRRQTAFDIAHAQLVLSAAQAASNEVRHSVSTAAAARFAIGRKGFGLLRRWFPHSTFEYRARIAAGLRAYAYGDAFGLPWEGQPIETIDLEVAQQVPQARDWPQGATSDDTALSFLVAEVLGSGTDDPAPRFMALLVEREPNIMGLGPSTTEAITTYRESGGSPTEGGTTNGAAMRALPVGWSVPLSDPERRRALTIELSKPTHPAPSAVTAACVMSACGSWALEGAGPQLLLDVAIEEAGLASAATGSDQELVANLEAVKAGTWSPPTKGITLDATETVTAVMWSVAGAASLRSAIETAVGLGGDTDTVAALVGGILGCRMDEADVDEHLPWRPRVNSEHLAHCQDLAAALSERRLGDADG